MTKNINAGRFLVLYYAHGGSKNMVYPYDKDLLPNGHDRNDRDFAEGWHSPYFNTSYFSDLMNGNNTPLVISIACNTGWFDGETDQTHMDLSAFDPNPFNDYENECFAENITRLATGGAVAAISASRPAYSRISADMLNGIVQAFWPGFLGSENQPIYEIGGALLFGKLYSAKLWMDRFTLQDVVRTTFEVFHLFGDPETQLWTDVPSRLSVTHPEFIGVSNPQKFVVTVRDERTHDPVDFAKVCIQQGSHIYQVGYTDTKGQIIFDCNPEDVSSYLNLTVTKHNYVPYINEIHSVEPDVTGAAGIAPQITLSHYSGTSNDEIAIGVSGFDDAYPVLVYFAGIYIATISAGEQSVMGHVPEGGTGYVNVWAYQGNTVAITRYYRLESSDNPDLYIYSQDESSTWHLADGVRVWDNPCITIFDGFSPTTNVQQHRTYDVKVTVYNKASASADDTDVTLFYASTGGGVSWTVVDTDTINIGPFGVGEATISWTPPLPNSACLKVEIEHVNERPEDTADNIGYECVDIIPLCSPGSSEFEVRNPTDTADYVLVKIRQEGDYDDVWKAAVVNYSSQALSPGESKTAAILIDPGVDIDLEDARLFTTEVFIGNDLIGGMIFDATVNTSECVTDRPCFCPIIILAMLVAGVILVIWYRKRSR
ncbi:MAG: C25 family cysteine peptidase [Candidatus Thorarchaeota archaeon]